MVRPAGRNVSLAELRFKPANSNDAARAALSHHFVNVPHCSFARDDGISPYLSAETGIDTFPAAPGQPHQQTDIEVPAIQGEPGAATGPLAAKLRRGGFALSVFLHAMAAAAFGYLALPLPDEAQLEEGTISITFVTEGTADADARAAGAEEETEKTVEKPVREEPKKPVEEKPVEEPEPVPATTETVLEDVPLPVLGAEMPESLTAKTESEVKVEAAAKPAPTEEKNEEKPSEQPKPIVKVEEPKKEELKKKPEKKPEPKKKEKPPEKQKQKRGNRGDQQVDAKKGDIDSTDKGKASTNSRGDVSNKEIGNAARSNYKGLVNRKLVRAKGRIESPAKGKVTVAFTIEAGGAISGLRVTQSSGKPAIDAIALRIVRSATPFPPIPTETGKKSWKMTVPMTFK